MPAADYSAQDQAGKECFFKTGGDPTEIHDASACLEHGKPDTDCCGYDDAITCKTGYRRANITWCGITPGANWYACYPEPIVDSTGIYMRSASGDCPEDWQTIRSISTCMDAMAALNDTHGPIKFEHGGSLSGKEYPSGCYHKVIKNQWGPEQVYMNLQRDWLGGNQALRRAVCTKASNITCSGTIDIGTNARLYHGEGGRSSYNKSYETPPRGRRAPQCACSV